MPKTLHALADAWLAGWDAGRAGKPESACPFHPIREGEENQYTNLWTRGWVAALRNRAEDQRAKNRFLALSIGVTTTGLDPDEARQ